MLRQAHGHGSCLVYEFQPILTFQSPETSSTLPGLAAVSTGCYLPASSPSTIAKVKPPGMMATSGSKGCLLLSARTKDSTKDTRPLAPVKSTMVYLDSRNNPPSLLRVVRLLPPTKSLVAVPALAKGLSSLVGRPRTIIHAKASPSVAQARGPQETGIAHEAPPALAIPRCSRRHLSCPRGHRPPL